MAGLFGSSSFCNTSTCAKFGAKFVVCDAGGSTVDISAYRVNSRPGEDVDVEELEHPSCKFQISREGNLKSCSLHRPRRWGYSCR